MDELELDTDAQQDQILDVYCNDLGLNQICLGPFYALPYDQHWLPPIDWTKQDIFPLIYKLKARGLHLTLATLPDCPPYFDGRTWDWRRLDADARPIYERLMAERLVDSVRVAWEVVTESAQLCEAARWLRTIFMWSVPVLWHNAPGHLSPGLSSEDEQRCWRDFLAAGGSGLDAQSDPPLSRPDALRAMVVDTLTEMRCRSLGIPSPYYPEKGVPWGTPLLTNQGQPMLVRNAEYAAYDLYHNRLPWAVAQAYGQAGMTCLGPGDDTALDGI
jgi:hypothetical protein